MTTPPAAALPPTPSWWQRQKLKWQARRERRAEERARRAAARATVATAVSHSRPGSVGLAFGLLGLVVVVGFVAVTYLLSGSHRVIPVAAGGGGGLDTSALASAIVEGLAPYAQANNKRNDDQDTALMNHERRIQAVEAQVESIQAAPGVNLSLDGLAGAIADKLKGKGLLREEEHEVPTSMNEPQAPPPVAPASEAETTPPQAEAQAGSTPAEADTDDAFRAAYVTHECGADTARWPMGPWPTSRDAFYQLVDDMCGKPPVPLAADGSPLYEPGEEPYTEFDKIYIALRYGAPAREADCNCDSQ